MDNLMQKLDRLVNPGTTYNDDSIRILNTYIEYAPGMDKMEYIIVEMEIRDNTGRPVHLYKAVRFLKILKLPDLTQGDVKIMDKQEQINAALYENEVKAISILARIENTGEQRPLGLIQLYGVQGVDHDLSVAKWIADNDFAGLRATLQGTFRTLEYAFLTKYEAEWLREKMSNMKYLEVVRGIPLAKKSASPKNAKGLGSDGTGGKNGTQDTNTEETSEEFAIGMSGNDFVMSVLTSPVRYAVLESWLAELSRQQTAWASIMQGSTSIGAGINIPVMFAGNLGSSLGSSEGVSDSQSTSESYSSGVSESDSTSYSESSGLSNGYTQGHTSSYGGSESFGESFSESEGFSESHSKSTSISMSQSISQSESVSESESLSESWGVSHGESESLSHSLGQSEGTGYGESLSQSVSSSHSLSASDSTSLSQNKGSGETSGMNYAGSGQHSNSENTGGSALVLNNGHSYGDGGSGSLGYSAGGNSTQGVGLSESSGVSEGWNEGFGSGYGESQSASVGKSESWGKSWGTSEGWSKGVSSGISQGTSRGQSFSQSVGQGFSESVGESVSHSTSQGISTSRGTSWSESDSVSHSTTTSQSVSNGVGHSTGKTYGTSTGTGRSTGRSSGSSQAVSTGTSASMGVGASLSIGKSYQFEDKEVKNIYAMFDFYNNRLQTAIMGNSGAFFTDVYIATETREGLNMASALAKSAWFNGDAMACPLQVIEPTPEEQQVMLKHFNVFSPYVKKERSALETIFSDYSYSTVLTSEELSAYTHLLRVSDGGIYADIQNPPKLVVPNNLQGDIYIGKIMSGHKWDPVNGYKTNFDYRIDNSSIMHALFAGASRSGKTVAAVRYVAEIANHIRRKPSGKRMRIVALDPKHDWRLLAKYVEPERFRIYDMGDAKSFSHVKLNPLKVPYGVAPEFHLDVVTDVFVRAYGLGVRSVLILMDAFKTLYERYGVFETDDKAEITRRSGKCTMKAACEVLKEKKETYGRDKQEACDKAIDRLERFTWEGMTLCELYSQEDGMSIDELLGTDDIVVLESGKLQSNTMAFIFGIIAASIYTYAKYCKGNFLADDQYETLLVVEEANKVLTGTSASDSAGGVQGESIFEEMLDQAAGLGIFVVVVTQTPSQMPLSVLANAGLHFSGKLTISDDIELMLSAQCKEVRYQARDLKTFMPAMPTGQFIVSSKRNFDYKSAQPVHVAVSRLDADPPSDEELQEMMLLRQIDEANKQIDLLQQNFAHS